MNSVLAEQYKTLEEYCIEVKQYFNENKIEDCEALITEAMQRYPHSAKPHNWMGVLLKERRDLIGAMKHFRAACALEPNYLPARYNIEQYGNVFRQHVKVALDESECTMLPQRELYKIVYDENGIGYVVKR